MFTFFKIAASIFELFVDPFFQISLCLPPSTIDNSNTSDRVETPKCPGEMNLNQVEQGFLKKIFFCIFVVFSKFRFENASSAKYLKKSALKNLILGTQVCCTWSITNPNTPNRFHHNTLIDKALLRP